MFKFAVISLFVLGCSAGPYSSPYSSYGSSSFSGSSFSKPAVSTIAVAQPSQFSWAQPAQVAYTVAQPAVSYVAQPLSTGFLGSTHNVNYGHHGYSGLVINSGLSAQKNYEYLGGNSAHASHQFESVVPAAIQNVARTVEYRSVPHVEQPHQAQVIEVEASDNPIHIHFKTRSSSLSLSQSHTPAAPQEVQVASVQDETARLVTEVQKPVIQEVRETVSPYRSVHQTITPLVESVHSVVTRGEGQRAQYTGANYASVQSTPAVAVQPVVANVQTTPAIAVQPVVANVQTTSYSHSVPQVAQFAHVSPVSQVSNFAHVSPVSQVANFAQVPSLTFASHVSPVVQAVAQPTEWVAQTKPSKLQTSYKTASTVGGY